jgi:hypothetical protein
MIAELLTGVVDFTRSPLRQDGHMTETTATELQSISVRFDSIRWEVDFGGGITQRFAARDDAIAAAQHAAATEGRELDIKS